jgi:hypothetical protein
MVTSLPGTDFKDARRLMGYAVPSKQPIDSFAMRKIGLADCVLLPGVQVSPFFLHILRGKMVHRPTLGQESMMPRAMAIVTA